MGVRPANFDPLYGGRLSDGSAVAVQQALNALAWKRPVRVATTANVTIATALNAGDTIDGVTLAAGDRVLVWQQSTASQNGIYIVAATPTRAGDFDSSAEIVGAIVTVLAGTSLGGQTYRNTNTATITVDTDSITFEAFGGAAEIPVDHGNMGATETLDFSAGTWHRGTLNADCTITVTGYTVDQGVVALFKVTQDGTGGWAITWDPDVVFAGDDQPGQAAAAVTWYLLWSDEGDSVVYGAKVGSAAFGTPAIVLGTAAADGTAATMLRTDATIVAFDGSTPATVAATATTGTAAYAARADHVHAGVTQAGDHQHIANLAFSGDGSTTAFELPAAPFDEFSVMAYVAGVRTSVTLSGTLLTTMTFGSAPASGTDNITVDIVAALA